jgi:hypothetical protein
MKLYGNWSNKSDVSRYDDTAPNFIIVEFGGKKNYRYSGSRVPELKKLAASGSGLAEYIRQNKDDLTTEYLPDSVSYS